MNNNSWLLTDIEKDLFREIANIGLSKAADAMAVLTKEKVLLNVPDIQLLPPNKVWDVVIGGKKEKSIAVISDIKGELEGKTLLLFETQHIEKFLEATLDGFVETNHVNRKQIESSMLLELSNIITGSILTQFANIFNLNIWGSVPQGPDYDVEHTKVNILKSFPSFQPLIFTIKTRFLNSENLVELPLMIVFDTDTLLKLLAIVRSKNHKDFNLFAK